MNLFQTFIFNAESHMDWILSTSDSITLVWLKILGIFQWISQAWFVLVPFLGAAIHLVITYVSTEDLYFFHQIVALVLKLIGGFLILWSINAKNGIMSDKSLLDLFIDWLNACPLRPKSLSIEAQAGSATGHSTVLNAEFQSCKNADTVEEKLEYLQRQIDFLKEDLQKETMQVKKQIAMNSQKIDKVVSQTQKSFNSVSQQLHSISVGGLGRQIFGVMLVIYGAIVNFLLSHGVST